MNQITCPNCGHTIELSMTDYNRILQEVRDNAFEKELNKRVLEAKESLQAKHELALEKSLQKKDVEYETAMKQLRKELMDSKEKQALEFLARTKEFEKRSMEYEERIRKTESECAETVKKLELEVDYYKNFKLSSSTKAVGESLEQFCSDEFDKLRATAFCGDYFEKDNKLSETGSKGDFIYRAYDENGEELVSIMFEMKNEMQSTVQKHKNADFFKELDKDRREKHCEYAVLVSLLEAESDLYNQGIVDVSHRFEKMYVIRPQFFIIIISLLRNAAKGQLALKRELECRKREDADFTELETSIQEFKDAFFKNYDLAQRKFEETVNGIDKAIALLQKTKDSLTSCERNMRLAGDKTEKLSLVNLTKNAPGIRERIGM